MDLPDKPDILWIHGDSDAIVSDASFFDLNCLGKAGVLPGWPGEETAPLQPMVSQTRAVLEKYAANGGRFTEILLENCGHSPHLEYPDRFIAELTAHIGRSGTRRSRRTSTGTTAARGRRNSNFQVMAVLCDHGRHD